VCTGTLEGNTLTCPWHGYQYDVTTGQLLLDRNASLPRYHVELRDDQVYLYIPILIRDRLDISLDTLVKDALSSPPAAPAALAENELRAADLPPGQAKRVTVAGQAVAVFNVDGAFYATQDACTHAGGPLSEGALDGVQIVCPWHASCFDVTNGEVRCGPAKDPLRTFRVRVEGEVLRVEPGE
jgi:3-phenylpropionate/trans-cinnamate dioxygenase ferredoxin subunit